MSDPSRTEPIPRRTWLAFAAAVGATALTTPAQAANDIPAIVRARKSLRSLTAKFTQQRSISLLATTVSSKGLIAMASPNRLRWELLAPDAVTYWITPAGLSFVSATSQGTADRATAGPLAASLDDLLNVLGGDLNKVSARYELTCTPSAEPGVTLCAVPRASTQPKHFKRLEIVLGRDLVSPVRITMEENATDRIVVRFEDVRVNPAIDPARLRPPPKR